MIVKTFSKAIAVGFAWISTSLAAPAIWDGSADDSWYEPSAQAYNLVTAEQLAGLAKLVNEGTSDFSGKTITLGADIFLNDTAGAGAGTWASIARKSWTPIGTANHPFKGEFDGIAGKKNRKIYGLYINDETKNNTGLFGYTDGVIISNLDLLVGGVTAANNTGALIGIAASGSITNVHSEIKVTGKNRVGGLVGYYIGDISKSSVQENVVGQDTVGGLVGYASGLITGSANAYSYFYGNVTGNKYVGGLVGYTYGAVKNSYSEGEVTGKSSYVGGLVGYGKSISGSYHKAGSVKGLSYVGGLAGYASGSVLGSHSEGDVSGTGDYIGGLIGLSYYYYSGSAAQTIVVADNSYSIGNVKGAKYVGGLVGLDSIYRYSSNTYRLERQIKRSYVHGAVEGTQYIGGVLGKSNFGYRSSSYSSNFYSTIDSVSHTNGNVNGAAYVGGLVGYTYGTVKNSFSEGDVSGTSDYVGGLIGLSYYYYSGSEAQTIVVADNSYSIGNVKGAKYVGGLVGLDSIYRYSSNTYRLERQIKRSYVHGAVEGTQYIGGVLGKSNFGYRSSSYSSNFYSTIDSVSHTNGIVKGESYVGGLVGYTYASVTGSHSEGDVIGTADYVGGLVGKGASIKTSYHEKGNVSGKGYVGGLVGYGTSIGSSYHEVGDVVGTSNYVGGLVGYGTSIGSSYHKIGGVDGAGYVGGLAGYVSGSIMGSHSEDDVTGTADYVGGLVGTGASIKTSYHEKGNVSGKGYVGGLAGASGAVSDSHSEGGVTGTADYVGGLVGKGASIKTSYHEKGSVSGNGYVGGLAGASDSVSGSHSEDDVTGTADYVGGLVGSGTSIETSYHEKGNVSGKGYVGGLAGASGAVSDSHSEGGVTGTADYVGGLVGKGTSIKTSYHEKGNVSGKGNVGGLVGYTSGSVLGSYSKGDVLGTGNYVGGLIGLSYYYYSGSAAQTIVVADSSYSIGNVKGAKYVGGLVGLDSIYRYSNNKYLLKRQIRRSYAQGAVEGTQYTGGVLGKSNFGYRSSSYSSNFYATIDSVSHINGNVDGVSYVGGLAGYTYASMTCSYSEGDVIGTGNYIGGLLGMFIYTRSTETTFNILDTVRVKDSYAVGDVKGAYYVGGLVGKDSLHKLLVSSKTNGSTKILYRLISNAYLRGNVEGKLYVGGLVGVQNRTSDSAKYVTDTYIFTTIDSCYHGDGTIKGDSSYIGGLIGSTYGSVLNSYSEGDVTGLDYVGGTAGSSSKIRNSYAKTSYVKGRNNVGGISGYVTDSIRGSYFEGDSVTGIFQVGGLAGYAKSAVDSSYATAHVKGDDNVGGLIGSAYGNVSNSYALGNVDGDVDNSSAGNDNLGGLVGYQYGGSVNKSMALGNVSGTTKIGGLVGRFEGSSITDSYANGNVRGYYYGDPADEVGNLYIGGLVGFAKGTLDKTYASGVVKGMDEDPVYTGCMVGYVNGSLSVTNSYYDKSKCSLGIDGGENSVSLAGTPDKTTAEMQIQSTFENWDFVDTWMIKENTYPFLRIYANSLANAVVLTESLDGIVYDGSPKTPLVTSVKLFGEALTYGTEYTITYANNENAGTATISVCGVKPYGGCKIINYEISAKTIAPVVATIANVTYTGKALTPEISVYNGETLLGQTDYTVEYKNNVNVGLATVSVTMKGNYSGSATATFKIDKATPVVSQNPKAKDVIVGESLASSELTGGRADVEGVFVWKNPSTKPSLENDGYAVIFVPTDTDNYTNSEEIVVPVKVLDVVYAVVHAGNISIDSLVVLKDGDYKLPNVPDSVGYDFVGIFKGSVNVGNPGDVVRVDENTVFVAEYKIKKFVITFMNDKTELQLSEWSYGSTPEYSGETPVKSATAQYTYIFKGWNPSIQTVSAEVVYTAVFDSVVNEYVITFMDGEKELQRGKVAYGVVPQAPIVTLPENTVQYTYSFGGWDKEIVPVTASATYTAVVNQILNKYNVLFKDYDGTVLKDAVQYDYGTPAADLVKPANPTREETAQYFYSFKGWKPAIAEVSEDAEYIAEYDSTLRSYTIAFVNGTEELQTSELKYGVMPAYNGEIPTKTATAQYSYSFKGWNPSIQTVSAEVVYTAVFDSVVNEYVITFMDGEKELQRGKVAYGVVPQAPIVTLPENTVQYTYSFGGWDKEIVPVTASATYTAVVNQILNKYNVLFKDYDGTVLKDAVQYDYGTPAADLVKPANPTREETAQYFYSFKGWKPAIAEVSEDAEYIAEYDSTLRSYTIAFVNGTEELQTSELKYGVMPAYNGEIPTKTATAQYSYSFKGWNPEVQSVSGMATYTAIFDSVTNKYLITFKNGTNVLQSNELKYGALPVPPVVSLPENTAQYTYSFGGWDKEVVPVSASATYSAIIIRSLNKYNVVFKDYDESIIKDAVEYDYGTIAEDIDKPVNPTRGNTAQYIYSFKGWTPSLSDVIEDVAYTAKYDSTLRKYSVAFVDGSGTIQSDEVEYGKMPSYKGEIPIKAATEKYSYTFKGWTPLIASVTRSVTYTAVFDSALNKYEITFMNGDEVLQSGEVAYGSLPVAPIVALPENTAQYTYSFGGWDKSIVPVSGTETYRAVINRTLNKYSVVFNDYDGWTLKSSVMYDYGTSAADIEKPVNPIRGNTAKYAYSFEDWAPVVSEVTENVVYTAKYDSTIRSYAITFVNGSEIMQVNELDYGEIPSYNGKTPVKASTLQYTYTFKAWTPSITFVTRATTYTAVFDSVASKYVISFKNGDEVLQSGEVAYGSLPVAPTVTLPENTAQYTYSFGGWDKSIVPVSGPETYSAIVNRSLNKYNVSFKDYDGIVLKTTDEYGYGTSAEDVVKPVDPTRENTAKYTYTFNGWAPVVSEVTGNVVYTAKYDSTIRNYAVTFVNGREIMQVSELDYGEIPSYNGKTPVKASTLQYTYTFKAWTPSITFVTRATTYTAVFDSVASKYVISFKNGDEVLQSGEVAYGSLPVAPTVTLPENTAQYTYSFGGWDKSIVPVSGPETYSAIVNRTLNKYKVSFKDYDGAILKSENEYGYGTSAEDVVKPVDPTRENTAKYTYTFKGWKPAISEVTENVAYTAEYDSTVRSYAITFVNGSENLQIYDVEYGKTPVYAGQTPVKISSGEYTYTFKGWTPVITSVSRTATYTAVFDSATSKYVITFKKGDEELQRGEIAYGALPVAPTVTLPENTAQYTYSFEGWDKSIVPVSGPETYTAIINRTLNKYKVLFKDFDGTILKSVEEYVYGTSAGDIVKPVNPTRGNTAKYIYTFKGWTPAISEVTENVSYTAVFDSTIRKYTIAFMNGSEILQSTEIVYGSVPSYEGDVPTKEPTSEYSYTFANWAPEIIAVTRTASYNAIFDSVKIVESSSSSRIESSSSSSKVVSSSSEANSSSSVKNESSSSSAKSSSSKENTPIVMLNEAPQFNVSVELRSMQISGVRIGSSYALLDMQGRVLQKGRVESANFSIVAPCGGRYLVRIGTQTKRVDVK